MQLGKLEHLALLEQLVLLALQVQPVQLARLGLQEPQAQQDKQVQRARRVLQE